MRLTHPLIRMDYDLIILGHVHDRGYGSRLWVTVPAKQTINDLDMAMAISGVRHLTEMDVLRGMVETRPELMDCFIFWWKGMWYFIPPGFVLDYYSVPRFLWFLFPPRSGYGDESALIHDFLCRFAELLGVSRREADHAFRHAMELYSLSFAKKKWLSVSAYSLIASSGDGRPSRDVRKAMDDRGDCWKQYKEDVERVNK